MIRINVLTQRGTKERAFLQPVVFGIIFLNTLIAFYFCFNSCYTRKRKNVDWIGQPEDQWIQQFLGWLTTSSGVVTGKEA